MQINRGKDGFSNGKNKWTPTSQHAPNPFRYIKYLKVKSKALKLLQKNIGKGFYALGIGKNSLHNSQTTQTIKGNINGLH